MKGTGISQWYSAGLWMIGGSSPRRGWNFSLRLRLQTGSGPTQPPIQRVPGTFSLGVKRPGSEAEKSPPSFHLMPSSRMRGIYKSIAPVRFHGVVLS
jgi:hypothetical protein